MSIIGKLVGGAIGFALGGPIGAIAGAVFGHAFDNKLADSDTAMSLSYGESSQITFFVAAFSISKRGSSPHLPTPHQGSFLHSWGIEPLLVTTGHSILLSY